MDNIENQETKQKMEEIKADIQKIIDTNEIEEIIKKNCVEFIIDGITYRVRRPTYKDKQEAYQKKIEKFTELLGNDKYKTENVLIQLYKDRGIDIIEMENRLLQLEVKKDDYLMQLGKMLKEGAPTTDLEKLKKEIEDLKKEILNISIKRTNLMSISIEGQVLLYTYQYITFLITEKKEGENWIRAFNTYDEYLSAKEELINKAGFNATLLTGQL